MLAYQSLASDVSRPLTKDQQLSRFVEDIITLNAEGDATKGRLYELGWPPKFIEDNLDAAKSLANKRFVRDVDAEPHRSLTSIQNSMADVIGSLLPPTNLLVAELQARGFSSAHIDLLLQKARAKAALAFCHGQTGWAN